MKGNKKLPYIFLGTLFCIFLLILGVNIGKHVEHENKQANFELSIAPTKTMTPIPTKVLSFKTYTHKNCRFEFLYPSSLTVTTESSIEAQLSEGKTTSIDITCAKTTSFDKILNDKNTPAENITLANKKISAKTIENKSGEFYVLRTQNPLTRQFITISILKNLYPLFEESFKFN